MKGIIIEGGNGLAKDAVVTTDEGHRIDYVTSATIDFNPECLTQARLHVTVDKFSARIIRGNAHIDNVQELNEELKHLGYQLVTING